MNKVAGVLVKVRCVIFMSGIGLNGFLRLKIFLTTRLLLNVIVC